MGQAKKPRDSARSTRGAGRPSDYTPELADRICAELTSGTPLVRICKGPGMPNPATVYRWLRVHETFRIAYEMARIDMAHALFDETLAIADDPRHDWVERVAKYGKDGEEDETVIVGDKDHIIRSRLRVDTRKWAASRLFPKKYGERAAVEVSGPDGSPITFAELARSARVEGERPKPNGHDRPNGHDVEQEPGE